MVERLLNLKNGSFNDEIDENNRMTKGQSFNTDDDGSLSPDILQQVEDENSTISQSDIHLLKADEQKRNLLLNSPSIDSINDPDGSISDYLISGKPKKKKQRRPLDRSDSLNLRKSYNKTRSWYSKIDLTKPIICIILLFLIYLMWIKRDVWIPRLLTSNARVRHTAIRMEQKLNEKGDSSSTKNSSSLSSKQDDILDDNNNQNNYINNNDQKLGEDNDEDFPTTSSKSTSPKLNLRVRRNKISFTRERRTRKHHSTNKVVDDDDDDDDDDENDPEDDDGDNDELTIKSNKIKEPALPSSIHSSKSHHHHHHRRSHRSGRSHQQKTETTNDSKTNLILRQHDDIVEQLQKLVKTDGRHRDLFTVLTKQTGLSKAKINRFIYGKDFTVITLDVLISFLKSFHSTLLIVPK